MDMFSHHTPLNHNTVATDVINGKDRIYVVLLERNYGEKTILKEDGLLSKATSPSW